MRVLVETQSFVKGEQAPHEWASLLDLVGGNELVKQTPEEYWDTKAQEKVTVVVTAHVGE